MLAKPFTSELMGAMGEYYIQRKYDGHRCLIAPEFPYSRGSMIINSIDHITDQITVPDDIVLDGELYIHGMPLQTIGSLVRKKQERSNELVFMCYDAIIPGATFRERLEFISSLDESASFKIAPTAICTSDQMHKLFRKYRIAGYEGAILRNSTGLYEPATRSKNLLKVKEFDDDEFTVIDINESTEGWAVLVFALESGITFSATAPGTEAEKRRCLKEKDKFIGRQATVEFVGYTIKGIPSQPVAKCWREEC